MTPEQRAARFLWLLEGIEMDRSTNTAVSYHPPTDPAIEAAEDREDRIEARMRSLISDLQTSDNDALHRVTEWLGDNQDDLVQLVMYLSRHYHATEEPERRRPQVELYHILEVACYSLAEDDVNGESE